MAHLGESRRGVRPMARADRLGLWQLCEMESNCLSAWRGWPRAFQRGSRMNVLLWDTRQLDVSKDFAGGFGVGMYGGQGGPRDAIVRWFYRRDHRPAALLFAYLAAVFARLGHRVKYVVDQPP